MLILGQDTTKYTNTIYLKYETAAQYKGKVKKYMRSILQQYIDPAIGEIDLTHLAEDAAEEFDLYCNDTECTIPEDVFEWAYQVAAKYEQETKGY